ECNGPQESPAASSYPARSQLVETPPILPLTPGRGREARLPGREFVRPDHHLHTVLPLDEEPLVGGLVSPLVHSIVAEDGFGLELQKLLPELFGIQAACSSCGLHEELAASIGARSVEAWSPVELFL